MDNYMCILESARVRHARKENRNAYGSTRKRPKTVIGTRTNF